MAFCYRYIVPIPRYFTQARSRGITNSSRKPYPDRGEIKKPWSREDLLKRVGSGSPPGEEDGETEGLNELGSQADADGVERSLLYEDLSNVL